MRSGPWPLGSADRPRSVADLLAAESPVLREWFRLSVFSWSEAEDDAERILAFAPLTVRPIEPAREVLDWLGGVDRATRLRIEGSIADVVEAWDPGRDPGATAVLLELAARLGCRGGALPLFGLLSKPTAGDEAERRQIANAVVLFVRRHGTGREAADLANRLVTAGLGDPAAIIRLLTRAAIDRDVDILPDILRLVPQLVVERRDSDRAALAVLRRFAASSLVDTLGSARAYILVLRAHKAGYPELHQALVQYRLRVRPLSKGQVELIDFLTSRAEIADVSGFEDVEPGAMATLRKLARETSIDGWLVAA